MVKLPPLAPPPRMTTPLRFLAYLSFLLPGVANAQGQATKVTPLIQHTPLSTSQGASPLELAAGQTWSTTIAAPFASRDIGLWYEGAFEAAQVELFHGGLLLDSWPLFEDRDQAPEHFPPTALAARPAGQRSVTGLAHSYHGAADSVRLTLTGPATMRAMNMVWIAPTPIEARPAVAPPLGSISAKASNYPKPPVSSRSSWAASPPQCSSSYCNTTHMGVHHTASSSDYAANTWAQAAANVKAIQSYHMYTNGWCDIGYNYLVTKEGWLFEGRAGGDDVKGAHDGSNCGSMGVASLGYFHTPVNNVPTAVQLNALAELGAWKFDQQGILPLGSSWYAGFGGVMPNVYGHRDVKATACPGDLLYSKMGEIRLGIDARLQGAPTSGKLKGVLYDANLGSAVRLVGTVALEDGTFVETGADGYFEFALQAGTYNFAATAPGHTPRAASETVSSGDVWESVGLWQGNVPSHSSTSLGPTSFSASFQGDAGSPVFMGYSLTPGIPIQPLAVAGSLWIDFGTVQILAVGNIPSGGTLALNLQVQGAPAGTNILTQGYLISQGQARLTNGAAWRSQ
jgi:hypothetical protein